MGRCGWRCVWGRRWRRWCERRRWCPRDGAGLAYPGVAEEEGFSEVVYLCGLRQNAQDRSNVAFQNMGAEEEGAITLKTTVYSGEAGDASARVLDDVTT